MKEYKIVGLSFLFFIVVCLSDAVFESLVFHEKPFLDSVLLDVSPHAIFLRSMVTAGFLVFGLIVSRSFHRLRVAEQTLEDRSARLADSNRMLEQEIAERKQLEEDLIGKEERFRQIYEKSPVMMHSIDENGIVRNVNGRWLEVLGYSREEALGRNITFVMTLESAERARTIVLPQYWKEGSVKDVPYHYIKKDGTIIDVLLDSVIMDDPAWGKVSLSTVRNITLRKMAEEESKRARKLLDSIIQNLPTPVFLKDAEKLRYLLWNRASEELYGFSSDEVVGKTARAFFPGDQADRFEEQDRQVLMTGALVCIPEQFVQTKEKGTRIMHTKKLPILDDDGNARYLAAISEDITERTEAQQALVRAREAAEQASRAKSEFLANMSHEIRTPINGIMGMTELALNTEVTPEQHEYLEAVRISADSLLKLINDILDFSKIEAGKFDLIDVEFNLRDVLADTMTMLAVQAHKKNLELLYNVPPQIPDAVVGDPGRLRQILVNLVGNAIKFTEQGEVVVSVHSSEETDRDVNLHFTVTDTGIGIPSDKQEKIFRSFEQADGSTSRKYGGTGLGLAISSRFCELMGGKIWVESLVGKGSTFHFTVRLNLQIDGKARLVADESINLANMSILVVDDNATNRTILEQILLYWGVRPTVVDSGAAALAAMEQACNEGNPFPLVITDCMMPEMDGFTLVESINKNPRLATPTIVMLTSSGERGDASRCLKLGIAAYLLKPVKQSELLFAISRALQGPSAAPSSQGLITRHSIRESKRRLNILLAEDNAVNQKLAVKMLERMGHTVTVAENGIEALELVGKTKFDLVLMDVQMPEMDGLEATRELRDREKATGNHIPVIAMTAYAMNRDKERCLEAGMDGYISKPISAQELYETIEHILRSHEKEPPQPQVAPSRRSISDKTGLLDRVGGDAELLKEIAGLFLGEYPGLLSKIRRAFQENDAEGLEKAAHALKGSVGNFGAEDAVQAALRIERMGRAYDLSEAEAAIQHLESEIERVRQDLMALEKEIDAGT